ncbi:head GIN domain-containing protein [Marinilabilia sp.]
MNIRFLKYIIGASFLLSLFSCDEILNVEIVGDGNTLSENRDVSFFDEINISAGFEVVLSNGESPLTVEADSNLLSYIETEVVNNQLQIDVKPNFEIVPRKPVRIYVRVSEEFGKVEVTGGGTIITDSLFVKELEVSVYGVSSFKGDTLGCSSLNLYSEGSTNVNIKGTFQNLAIRQIGSGNISMRGKTDQSVIILEGSGKIDNHLLLGEDADISIYGSGLVLCYVSGALSASIDGSGRIYYYGTPSSLEKNIEGKGLVLPADD